MNSDFDHEELDISYPCKWGYRIICTDETAVRAAVAGIVGEVGHSLIKSHTSKTGKYCSLQLELTVRDEEHRLEILRELQEVAEVKYVL